MKALARVAKDPKISLERFLEVNSERADLMYEKPPEIVHHTFEHLVIDGLRLDRCDTCGKRTDLIHSGR